MSQQTREAVVSPNSGERSNRPCRLRLALLKADDKRVTAITTVMRERERGGERGGSVIGRDRYERGAEMREGRR